MTTHSRQPASQARPTNDRASRCCSNQLVDGAGHAHAPVEAVVLGLVEKRCEHSRGARLGLVARAPGASAPTSSWCRAHGEHLETRLKLAQTRLEGGQGEGIDGRAEALEGVVAVRLEPADRGGARDLLGTLSVREAGRQLEERRRRQRTKRVVESRAERDLPESVAMRAPTARLGDEVGAGTVLARLQLAHGQVVCGLSKRSGQGRTHTCRGTA